MVFGREGNRELLQSLKDKVQRDKDAGEYVPPHFDSILQTLDNMAADIDHPRSRPQTPMPVIPADHSPGRKEYEVMGAYNSLLKAGGRPICPLGDTASISAHPGRHRDILSPWVDSPVDGRVLDWKDIYQQQLANWQRFKAWQRKGRGPKTFPSATVIDEGFESSTSGSDSNSISTFDAHVEATIQRLARHGFTKLPDLKLDSSRQDEWTCWVEYLSFEYYCFERYATYYARERAQENGQNGGFNSWAKKHHNPAYHNIIIKWALLQEAEIAARAHADSPATERSPASEYPRQKRLRDGSLREAVPISQQADQIDTLRTETVQLKDQSHANDGNAMPT
ncbi:hypothetical protein QQS21_011325 [Conoideocrella luteorostrata]|uniref:Uncharacterized protein n=1 Tax=Conoideocrella luteorostrata TaxID=1105319 RepID=A0AAJ0CG34_9HYPO|nr:hypothetical protein QQS21_011325 [Conoideocrella luteorostrata]